ncbi:MAG: L-ribulose-5-phosphate 4-epimerase AraD [Fidelibacterota bacterium]|nr:MAG: L-ribulose-5-phosphate 4-epimerase AraD [Candidatus Neomarinimicrobiota bacterium]
MYDDLKADVCKANLELDKRDLVIYSWGNVSGIDREKGIVAIKPSGVAYEELTAERMVLVNLEGKVVEGDLRPSSDLQTHLELYGAFEDIGGVCHTHSTYATIWSQACREIPCLGTTHADHFHGPIPVTDEMEETEIASEYELNTGKMIVRRFQGLNALELPAVLVANHGPFTWGRSPSDAVVNAVILEQVARMAYGTLLLHPGQKEISEPLRDKHFRRKHGREAYYGQEKEE